MYKGPLLLTVSAISGGGKTAVVKALTKVFKEQQPFILMTMNIPGSRRVSAAGSKTVPFPMHGI